MTRDVKHTIETVRAEFIKHLDQNADGKVDAKDVDLILAHAHAAEASAQAYAQMMESKYPIGALLVTAVITAAIVFALTRAIGC